MSGEKTEAYGFLLVTSDPVIAGGGKGVAFDLVQARLQRKTWPIYERTRNRDRFGKDSRVAFYVSGTRKNGGCVVAVATVAEAKKTHRTERLDPPEFLTDAPSTVLELKDVQQLDPPIQFVERLPALSFCPKDLKKWGNFLQGGARAFDEADWKALLAPTTRS